jgi:hypothetical protein
MGARKFLRYGVSLVMIGLGVGVIYYEYLLYQRTEGLLLGGLLIGWAFVRVWMLQRFVERRALNRRRNSDGAKTVRLEEVEAVVAGCTAEATADAV